MQLVSFTLVSFGSGFQCLVGSCCCGCICIDIFVQVSVKPMFACNAVVYQAVIVLSVFRGLVSSCVCCFVTLLQVARV